MVIHLRDAYREGLDMLEETGPFPRSGVIHCFSGNEADARRALDLGFYVSFSGIITFKNAADLREVVKKIPAERLLIETDAPYLAPVPHRGKPNLPCYVTHVADCVAELRGMSPEAVAELTTENYFRLFQESAAE